MDDISTATTTDPLLDDLTDAQRQAVVHVDGPLLVLAGAGSGKTRVITRRVAYLIHRMGVAPWNILAITFTNKAAAEMRGRLGQLASERQANAVTATTFHSFCARLIRQYADRLGLEPGYSIYDASDQKRAMVSALKTLLISKENFPPQKVLGTISKAKNNLVGPQEYAATASEFYTQTVARIYTAYQQVLTKNNALDFDDLLLQAVRLFKGYDEVLEELRERYRYLLIDEYQDTNHAQFVLANALAGGHQNICATGDPDQAIYGWRGANLSNILEFESHYPDATVVRLEQNYRSTQSILAVADGLIQQNTRRKAKALWTENDAGQPVQVVTCLDEHHEADWVVRWFISLHEEEKAPWGQMAVLYRVNSLSRVLEDALRGANIPYQIARGTAFYDRAEIKQALAYLQAIVNSTDEQNLLRMINMPARGISTKTVGAMQEHAVARGLSLGAVISSPEHVAGLNPRAVGAMERFGKMMNAWRAQVGLGGETLAAAKPVGDEGAKGSDGSLRGFVAQVLRESGLEAHYRDDKSDPDQERLMNLGELVNSAQQFEDTVETEGDGSDQAGVGEQGVSLGKTLMAYLEQISLVSDVDAVDSDQGTVTLMTLHAAKGLEFPVIAMVGLEDGLLPHGRAGEHVGQIEEERRLCFVGITRTQERLALTHACSRSVFGKTMPTIPSRFLNELPEEHIKTTDLSGYRAGLMGQTGTHRTKQLGQVGGGQQAEDLAVSDELGGLGCGVLVRHRKFGLGRVEQVMGRGSRAKVVVGFNTVGVKTLVVEYAGLEIES